MKKSHILVLAVAFLVSCSGLFCLAACPSMDFTGDCRVGFADFALFAEQWLDVGIQEPNITWVSINDPGVGSGYEGFNGQMSKYETTNAQYCQFLNAALATGDIAVSIQDTYVYGANGSNSGNDFEGQIYYDTAGSGYYYNGAVSGGAARINYSDGVFTVDSGFENHPVTYVNWYGATAFCNYYGYRLPTEWEWQAVADYGGTYIYGCGTSINNSIANYLNSSHPDGTTAVGLFGTYGYGLCDMAGNVWEWTDSIHPGGTYVTRGGSWEDGATYCQVANHSSGSQSYCGYYIGFRVCR
ncbi:MAG: SUMF1/EgtB/PvdO family nonheme iron enzyme [Phycisphaerae bacterium]